MYYITSTTHAVLCNKLAKKLNCSTMAYKMLPVPHTVHTVHTAHTVHTVHTVHTHKDS